MTDYVYIVGPVDGPVKIGFTRNPVFRVSSFVRDASLVALYKSTNRGRFGENAAHLALAAHRLKGEWFSVIFLEAVAALDAISQECGISKIDGVDPNNLPTKDAGPNPPCKQLLTMRMSKEAMANFKHGTPGFSTRVNQYLRDYVDANPDQFPEI